MTITMLVKLGEAALIVAGGLGLAAGPVLRAMLRTRRPH